MIKVTYDGEYPCSCMGTLTIEKDGIEIYKDKYCCYSTGHVWFDENWNEHVESGELIWKDSKKFSEDIQEAVRDALSKIGVCCGGCV